MADSLRRLSNIGSFSTLQDKLDRWLDVYNYNTADENVARCCEIIELNGKVQGQLFKLLSLVGSEGGISGHVSAIKRRLLPVLDSAYWSAGVTAEASLAVLSKEREIREVQDLYEDSLATLEDELNLMRRENDDLRDELLDTKDELNNSLRVSESDRIADDAQMKELRSKLADCEAECSRFKLRLGSVDDLERQCRKLQEDIAVLTGRRDALRYSAVPPRPLPSANETLTGYNAAEDELLRLRARASLVDEQDLSIRRLKSELAILRGSTYTNEPGLAASRSPNVSISPTHTPSKRGDLADSLRSYRCLSRATSPLSTVDVTQRVRQEALINRFNDIYAINRLTAMETLGRYQSDYEMNQRICNAILQEAFIAAKLAFRDHKMKVRSNLAITHVGPETLEEVVQDYINRNTDMYDLPGIIMDVVNALNRNVKLFLPVEASYDLIKPYIREACKLAWECSSLAHPLDVALASDAELYDDSKYRRSYDSEYTAPLVDHHIFPCLMQGLHVLVKGEVCTRRGASLGSSRSPSRSLSPRPTSPFRSSRSALRF